MKMTEQISELDGAVSSLAEIREDLTVPKNVRMQIQSIIDALKQSAELSIKVNKALNELGSISGDVNLQSYTRMQIWNIMSMLEKL